MKTKKEIHPILPITRNPIIEIELRDYFAMSVAPAYTSRYASEQAAAECYRFADDMMKARKK